MSHPVRRILSPTLGLLLSVAAVGAADAAKVAVTSSSFQPNQGNEPEMAIDGSSATFWHSAWNPMAALPQSLTIDYGAVKTMASMVYQPRPGGGNGTVTRYDLSVSSDGTAFTTVVKGGTFADDGSRKFVNFEPVQARWVRLDVLEGHGGFASAAELFTTAKKLDAAPPDPGHVSVAAPAYGAEIKGRTTIKVSGPGLTSAKVSCWKQGDGLGAEATVGTIALDDQGAGAIDFPADDFPHGPLCVTIAGSNGTMKDNCYLQLFNQGGVAWHEGLPKDPPAAAGMTLLFADDFDQPLDNPPRISGRDSKGVYYEHKPPDGSQDFSSLRFTGYSEPGNPFARVGSYLRIRADEKKQSAGLISSLKFDGTGVTACAPCYFECRFIGPNAPGTWPAFWLLTNVKDKPVCDELDIIEAYGGEGPKSPNAFFAYCVTPHAWNQGEEGKQAEQAALKQFKGQKGNAGMDWAPQVVSAKNIGIPSTWYQAMHTYAVKIGTDDTIYYCDDIEIARHHTLEVSKTAPFYFLINLATGGGWPVDLSRYDGRADMYVDWVRVYSGNADDIARAKAKKP